MDVSRNHIDKLRKDEKFIANFKRKMKFVQRDYETPCLEWQGGLDKAGYGRIHVKRHCERKTGRNFYAHRLNYMIDKNAFIELESLFFINVIIEFVVIPTTFCWETTKKIWMIYMTLEELQGRKTPILN